MQLQVWANLVKRDNSTAHPPHSPDQVLEVSLKKDTSLLNPSFIISGAIERDILNINYCAWSSHFYFVDDVIYLTNNQAEIQCSIDALATHKGDLLLQTFFIERASQNYNEYIYDPLVAQRASNQLLSSTQSEAIANWYEPGTYIVRVIGDNAAPATALGITSFALTKHDLNLLMEQTFDASRYNFLSDDTVKSFFNPFQYIVSVMWFPFSLSAFSLDSNETEITLGWFKTGRYAFTLKSTRFTAQHSLARPRRAYSDFRDEAADWSTLRVVIPGMGMHIFNPTDFGNESIRINYSIDVLTGDAIAYVFENIGGEIRGGVIASFSGKMGVSIQIGQMMAEYASGAKSIVSGLGNLLTGRLGDAFADAMTATTEICQPTPSVNGSAGTAASLLYTQGKAFASITTRASQPIAVNEIGRPVMKADILSNYKGYVKCSKASVILKATKTERDIINSYLNGGFFIE